MKDSKGFTLIELMVVVAIIGILASIALPAYQVYIQRSEVVEALSMVSTIRESVTNYYVEDLDFPVDNDAAGVPAPEFLIGNRITGVVVESGAIHNIEGSPSIPYLATGYDLDGFRNDEILILIDRFLENGADVNAQFQGYTALNGAILANSPELVAFLLTKGARTDIRVQREGIKHCNGLASLDFALCINEIGKQDLSKITTILRNKT